MAGHYVCCFDSTLRPVTLGVNTKKLRHEKTNETIKKIYPEGIHSVIADGLSEHGIETLAFYGELLVRYAYFKLLELHTHTNTTRNACGRWHSRNTV